MVWRVDDTAKAIFDVEYFEAYVLTKAESAVRHLALSYAYDNFEEPDAKGVHEVTLRRAPAGARLAALRNELQQRFAQAGIVVIDAKLTHLAYAPEIAGTMLRRQQAEAVIAARSQIVAGAVGMVEMALKSLSERDVVQLDDERRAAMVSNLLVVLCSGRPPSDRPARRPPRRADRHDDAAGRDAVVVRRASEAGRARAGVPEPAAWGARPVDRDARPLVDPDDGLAAWLLWPGCGAKRPAGVLRSPGARLAGLRCAMSAMAVSPGATPAARPRRSRWPAVSNT